MKRSYSALVSGLFLAAALPAAASQERILDDCAGLAREFFGVSDAIRTTMRYNGARVDGTETVGGEIHLEGRAPYVACAFSPDKRTVVEFFVDGEDQMSFIRGRTPNYERPVGGVLPPGSSFTAASQIDCSRGGGSGTTRCDAGVVREGNGNGFVTVFWPDGGNRVLYFENGTITRYDESEADGGAKLRVTRSGDIQIVTIGEMRFEIFDALLLGD